MVSVSDAELLDALQSAVRAPFARTRIFLSEIARATFSRAGDFSAKHRLMRVAYSVKTNPSDDLLRLAAARNFYAECISDGEVDAALRCGFEPMGIVYNGPKPPSLRNAPRYVFADSLEAFHRNAKAPGNTIVGLRLRPGGVHSRFGIAECDWKRAAHAVKQSKRSCTAISFQVRSEDHPPGGFRRLVDEITQAAAWFERESGAPVVAFDSGAGRSAREFDESEYRHDYDFLDDLIGRRLPNVRESLIEPGQEITAATEAIVAPVLEIRRRADGRREIVVDAGLPDVPTIEKVAHRICAATADGVELLRSGGDVILGRTCLETDVIGCVALPPALTDRDAIVIADAGAYDSSMHYAFAEGVKSGNTSMNGQAASNLYPAG
jgi:diaminopimelate decarboxylase